MPNGRRLKQNHPHGVIKVVNLASFLFAKTLNWHRVLRKLLCFQFELTPVQQMGECASALI